MGNPDGRSCHQPAQRPCGLDLPGVAAQPMDAWIERRIRPAGRVGRQGAGDQGRAEKIFRLEQGGQRIGGRELRAVQQGEAFLGAEHQRRQARLGQRPFGGNLRAVDEEGANADQRRRHVRQRRKVTRGADRALGRHHRRQSLGQQGLEQADGLAAHARRALGQACQLERNHKPRDGDGHRLADTGGVRQHDVALKPFQVSGVDAHAGELSEARVDAVDGLAPGEDGRDRPRRRVDRRVAARREGDRRAAIDVAPCRQRHGARHEQDRSHDLMVAVSPRLFAKEKLE